MNLHRELTGRRDDDGAWCVGGSIRHAGVSQQAIEQSDQERCGLSRAGLCLSRDVAARERQRQRLRLDRACTA